LVQQGSDVLDDRGVAFALGGYTKISNLYLVFFALQEDVVGLEITVDYILFVQVFQSQQYLNDESFYSYFCDFHL